MADKKTKQAEEVKTIDQLRADLNDKQNDFLEAKTSLAAGELINPRILRAHRKDIARLKTEIRARELAGEEK